jgi:hypothetical protein
MILSECNVKKHGNYWHVTNEVGIIGAMHDFYSETKNLTPGLSRHPFPFRNERNQYSTEAEANAALQKVRDHVKAVLAIEPDKRVGSSKRWTE